MPHFGEQFKRRREANARALAVFGPSDHGAPEGSACRCVREGNGKVLYTIGYERRTLTELVEILVRCRVNLLIDVRDKPFSRRPDFRAPAIQAACRAAGICYENRTELGSTETQRTRLAETHDYDRFRRQFRAFVRRYRWPAIARLSDDVKAQAAVLMCYERAHDQCHRSVLADLVAERLDATVTAIM